ncbi:hypothetical protein DSCA_07490 [Desulfosarcina alkanivorans]|uniref:Uncharacterized protein n=1 Tax=Desulfosarcina alkanivorans TaxID=571177 RepID=A0A5K7YGC1_9BACT|nr:hypothetical protein [Desulfosarcina alkanivorans]BBO66819.1 hypothetical protein DSCA_07490 [Desulfosarcina alkanivorans]
MAHEDAGHYGAKHPDGKIDTAIADEILEKEKDGRITCAAAHMIAKRHACPPKMVGMNIDLLEKRICKCQLGLYGYGSKKGKAVDASTPVGKELEKAIGAAMDGDRISCEAAWGVAKRLNLAKIEVSNACEALGIKICNCQLGAF